MDINVIDDELQLYLHVSRIEVENVSELQMIRLLSEETEWKSSCLYLWDGNSNIDKIRGVEQLNLVVTKKIDNLAERYPHWNIIFLDNQISLRNLYFEVQNIFQKYLQWEKEVLYSIARKEHLKVIFEKAAMVLKNPVAVFDRSLILIMKAGTVPENRDGTIWNEVLEFGYTRVENLNYGEQKEMNRRLSERKKPFLFRNKKNYINETHALSGLKSRGEVIGMLSSADIESPFTPGQLSLMGRVTELIELAIANDTSVFSADSNTEYYIARMLHGMDVNKNTVQYYLTQKGWDMHDHYLICYLNTSNGKINEKEIFHKYIYRIKSLFSQSNVSEYEDGILVIMHNRERMDIERIMTTMTSVINKLELICGISMEFMDFMNIKYAYIQAKAALEIACEENSIQKFSENYISYVVDSLEASTSLKSLCHPKVWELYNSEKDCNYVKTLKEYMLCGGNISLTAKNLSVHRNTLLYRLEKIKDVVGEELFSTEENIKVFLLLSCYIVERNLMVGQ